MKKKPCQKKTGFFYAQALGREACPERGTSRREPKRRSKLKNLARNGRFFLYSGFFGREAYPDRGISLKEPNRRAEFDKVIICVKDYHEPIAGFFIL